MYNLDNKVNVNEYNMAYKKRDKDKCINELFRLREAYKNRFREIFLISNCLKNPMGFNFNKEEFSFVIDLFSKAKEKAKNNNDFELANILSEFSFFNFVLFQNTQINKDRLLKNKFSEYSLAEQLLMICIFIQDQTRLMNLKLTSSYSNKSFITGMEMEVSNEDVHNSKNEKISLIDNYEGLLEQFNVLIRYLYAVKKSELNTEYIKRNGDITPYYIPSFEEIGYIANQRKLYLSLEERFRYTQWGVQLKFDNGKLPVAIFEPILEEEYKSRIIGGLRRKYNCNMIAYSNCEINKKDLAVGLNAINKLSNKYNNIQLEDWDIDRTLFYEAKAIVKPHIKTFQSTTKKAYINSSFNGIDINDYLKCFEFLYVLSELYMDITLKNFDENNKSNYKYLVPIIKIKYLTTQLSKLYKFNSCYSEKLINTFIFDSTIKNGEGDIFTLPLIRVSNSEVLLCNSLISQTNLERNVEILLSKHNVDLSVMGTEFENKIRSKLSCAKGISVNTNKVKFKAYDGKDVEFDCIATFEDHLLIIESKSILTPYDPKELFKCKNVIMEGVNQVLRRCEVIKHDWEKIKKQVNIDLPKNPYSDDKIIKIVCTNIYEFTSLLYEGVEILDESTLLKYFTDPKVIVFGSQKDAPIFKSEFLWKEGKPNIREFKEYLRNPVTIGDIPKYLKPTYRAIPFFEGDFPIAFKDFIFEEDPYSSIIDNKISKTIYKRKNIGRNEKCFCGSNKKYKKCCGEN